jgi:hypothetical protein
VSASPGETSGYSVAYKLAAIDCRCTPSAGLVAKYGRVLTKLTRTKCKDSKRRLGDMAVTSVRLLKDEGVPMSNLRMLRLVNASIPDNIGFKQPCADIFAILIASRS